MIDYSDIEEVIEQCFNETKSAARDKYDSDKADRTAALFLVAQMKLSLIIEDVEMQAKNAKNEIERLEGEKYFEYRTTASDKKITENMASSFISKDQDIVNAKLECAKREAELRKWNFVLGTLKDGHIYFRNIGKNKNWSE